VRSVLVAGLVALSLIAAGSASPATGASRQDVTIEADDGVPLAATLFEPSGKPPSGGWPAVVFMSGLGVDRSSMGLLAGAMGLVGEQYAVLTFDPRGQGASGGFLDFDGPREIADTREVFDWLVARPEIARTKIGAFGISYGGGAALNSLAVGVPWAAIEVVQTWTDLYSALAPDDLPKTGVVAGIAAEVPTEKLVGATRVVTKTALAGRTDDLVRAWAAQRSSLPGLRGKKTPVFFMQGRRDFTFGIDQATRGYAVLKGQKRLWIGNHGHPPSSFPAADTPKMLAEGKEWFDHFLRGVKNSIDRSKPVTVAAEGSARVRSFPALPHASVLRYSAGGRATIGRTDKIARRLDRTRTAFTVFGAPIVRARATARGGWSRLIGVLSAQTPSGKDIVVADGGTATYPGTHAYAFRLQSTATFVPKGSRLTLTLGGSSTVQSASNLVYLDLPMPAGARLTAGAASVDVPTLAAHTLG
jgi:X-Pro dipeptidyl-peptidase (S15 family)